MPNLVKLFSRHGAVYIDTEELSRCGLDHAGNTRLMKIYTNRGVWLCKTAKYREKHHAGWIYDGMIHPANVFASEKLAMADSARIRADMHTRAVQILGESHA